MSDQHSPDIATSALPITQKQLAFARSLALRNAAVLPWEAQQDRRALSEWIDVQKRMTPAGLDCPSSKQVAFAEKIARRKRTAVPEHCFKSREEMTRWISRHI